jgi:hypothetical protein
MKMRLLNIALLLFFFYTEAFTQSNCQQNIKQAKDLYNEGNSESCIKLLEYTLKECDFNKKEKEKVLEILAEAYIELDDIRNAEIVITSLLKNSPRFELVEAEHTEDFNRLIKKYDVIPTLSIGAKNAMMHHGFKSIKTYSISENIDYNSPYKTYGNGWYLNYYGWMEYQPFRSVSFNGDLIFNTIPYFRNLANKSTGGFVNYYEYLSFIELPLYVKKTFYKRNFQFSINGGFGYLYLTKSLASATITDNTGRLLSSADNINVTIFRKTNNFEWLAGGSIGYRLKNFRINLDIRYFGGLNNLVETTKRSENPTDPDLWRLLNVFNYIDNDFKFNKGFEIGVSLSYVIKNTVKRKRR